MAKTVENIFQRRIENVFPSVKEVSERISKESLSFYLGIDPTGPDLHIGHAIPLLFLKNIKEINSKHKIIVLFGDFTARIGDPTGKSESRKPLTSEEIEENLKGYVEQISRIIPAGSFEIKRNSEWLSKMSFEDVLRLTSRVTVQQMIVRDMFQERIKKGLPIGLHEFLYPLMQGYDSVAMNIDAEVGGNDQTFNMLVGRDLVKELQGRDKVVLATKLLVNPQTGGKMSKTEGSLISVNDSPEDMYGKTMANIPDDMIETVFRLCTETEESVIEQGVAEVAKGGNPINFKKELAHALVETYWNKESAEKAAMAFDKISSGDIPDNIPELTGVGEKIVEFLVKNDFGSSSFVKSLIDQGGVKINGDVPKWGTVLNRGDIVKVGSHKFVKVK